MGPASSVQGGTAAGADSHRLLGRHGCRGRPRRSSRAGARRRGRGVVRGRADGEPREGGFLGDRRARRGRSPRAVRSRPARPRAPRRDAPQAVRHRRLPGDPGRLCGADHHGDRQVHGARHRRRPRGRCGRLRREALPGARARLSDASGAAPHTGPVRRRAAGVYSHARTDHRRRSGPASPSRQRHRPGRALLGAGRADLRRATAGGRRRSQRPGRTRSSRWAMSCWTSDGTSASCATRRSSSR